MSPVLSGMVMAFDKNNMLARAVHSAFYDHFPLRLSPDAIWITIAQGFANHVSENAEALRSKFVQFKGQEVITVGRPDFVKVLDAMELKLTNRDLRIMTGNECSLNSLTRLEVLSDKISNT